MVIPTSDDNKSKMEKVRAKWKMETKWKMK